MTTMAFFRRLYEYRDLLLVFVWREFLVRYRQTLLGLVWVLAQPLSMMALFIFIFSYVLKIKFGSVPPVLFYFSGLVPWLFFSTALNYAIPSLTNHHVLITKIYFPYEILPLSGISLAFIDYLIHMIFFMLLLVLYKVHLTWNVLWYPVLALQLLLFTFSIALFLSGLNVYYRDVKMATGFLIQLWFFASPVMYSIDNLDMKIKILLFANPLTFIIENMRRCLFEGRGVIMDQMVLVTVFIVLLCWASYKYFLRIGRAFADVI